MNILAVLIALACLSVVWHIVSIIIIYENLRRRNEQVSFLWLRLMAPLYASRYGRITRAETGKAGPLFYHWLISINAALVFVILAIAVHYA
jgi:hypothetical protein